ncbi:uncharacterized protein LOC119186620 isoform X4 [Rhipicephalus microplus]|uniref:uncharacterized protein LOC119186620 isoform X4 n=1 Tax=Rhipicephalus microplus TaxID=6941 RepID=UPI003F6D170D
MRTYTGGDALPSVVALRARKMGIDYRELSTETVHIPRDIKVFKNGCNIELALAKNQGAIALPGTAEDSRARQALVSSSFVCRLDALKFTPRQQDVCVTVGNISKCGTSLSEFLQLRFLNRHVLSKKMGIPDQKMLRTVIAAVQAGLPCRGCTVNGAQQQFLCMDRKHD